VIEPPAKTEKGPKPEKASKTSSKKQKKSDKGGKGKDKGKSKAAVAPIVPGTSDAVPSIGATDPSPEQEPDSLDDGTSKGEPSSEPAAEIVSPDPALGLQKEEESENVVDDSPPPADPATSNEAEPTENSAAPADVEHQSEPADNASPAPSVEPEITKEELSTPAETETPKVEEPAPVEPEVEAVSAKPEAGKFVSAHPPSHFNLCETWNTEARIQILDYP